MLHLKHSLSNLMSICVVGFFIIRSLYNYNCLYTCMTTLVSRSAGITALGFLNVYGRSMDLMISIILAVFARIKGFNL